MKIRDTSKEKLFHNRGGNKTVPIFLKTTSKKQRGAFVDVKGFAVGHASDRSQRTGCTVILFDHPYPLIADVRGGAPTTRETASFYRLSSHAKADALVLVGGSAFGLAAADGVVSYLAERRKGRRTSAGIVPRVPAAVIYDLAVSRGVYPNAEMGRKACSCACATNTERGNVGAGTSATIGKMFGTKGWMKGGLGTASHRLPDGTTIGAIAVVNSFGDVLHTKNGNIVAGLRSPGHFRFADTERLLLTKSRLPSKVEDGNTTLVIVATDLMIGVNDLALISQAAHDAIAASIRPAHTVFDGDVVFAITTQDRKGSLLRVLAAAQDATQRAILDAVLSATSLAGIPSARDIAKWEHIP